MQNTSQRTTSPIVAIILILVLVVAAGIILWSVRAHAPVISDSDPVACTQEAKLCPDGSYVGRSGPSCAFAPCPELSDAEFATQTQSGISFSYPKETGFTYVHFMDWPPQVAVSDGVYSCPLSGILPPGLPVGTTEERTIEGTTYCVTTLGEGAAGSTYTTHTYAFARNEQTVTFSFSIREPQCLNYDEPNQATCKAEQEIFDTDTLVAQMAASMK